MYNDIKNKFKEYSQPKNIIDVRKRFIIDNNCHKHINITLHKIRFQLFCLKKEIKMGVKEKT